MIDDVPSGIPVTLGQGPDNRTTLQRVREFLLEHGASREEIDRAQAENVLDLLVADRILVPATRRYTQQEVSELSGMPIEQVQQFWRALGFADVSDEELAFTDSDIEAVLTFHAMLEMGLAEVDSALQLARVIGSSLARIADAEVSPASPPGVPGLQEPVDSVEEADRFAQMAALSLPAMARLLEFVWRRHMQAATRRAMMLRVRGDGGTQPVLALGFADMVGFTGLSQQLSQEELAAVVSRFEQVAHDTVTALGGRVIKMIGDEVMFVTETVVAAARIGLSLAEAYADDDLLSDVRVALAVGPVLIQDGDYFGPVVNLASRAVNIANPGSVLISDDFHGELVRQSAIWRAETKDQARIAAEGEGGRALPGLLTTDLVSIDSEPVDGEPVTDIAAGLESGGANASSSERSSMFVQIGEDEFVCKSLRPRHVKDLGRLQLWVLGRSGAEDAPLDRRVGRRWERLGEVLRDLDELRERGERLMAGGDWAQRGDRIRMGSVRTERTRVGDIQPGSGGKADGGKLEGL